MTHWYFRFIKPDFEYDSYVVVCAGETVETALEEAKKLLQEQYPLDYDQCILEESEPSPRGHVIYTGKC